MFYAALAHLDPALALVYGGDPEAARVRAAAFEEAAEASRNPTLRAWAQYVHGEALLEVDPAEAAHRLESAVEIARQVDSGRPAGVALVSLASLCGRHGETVRALRLFRDTVHHWRRVGNHTHQFTTLRNLVELLVRDGVNEPAALLCGAVTAASPPSFGAEAQRLADARRRLERRMGPREVAAAARRGEQLSHAQTVDEALVVLDTLLEE